MPAMQKLVKGLLAVLFLAFSTKIYAINDVYVIHFVLDGARYDVLNEEIQKGELPFIQKTFFEKGAVFEKTLTVFPTVSTPGYISFVTGLGTGNSGIFFLEWFDRTDRKVVGYLTLGGYKRPNIDLLNRLALLNPDVGTLYPPTTLFEKLAPTPSAAIYTHFRQGASIALPKKFPLAAIWNSAIAKNGLALDRLAFQSLKKVFSKPEGTLPRYNLVALYGADFYGHKTGAASDEIRWTLKQFDTLLENFADRLQKRGLLDKTYFIVSSDHGMHDAGKLFKLKHLLWNTLQNKKVAYAGNRGVSSTFLYFPGEKGWEDVPTLERLRHFPGKNKRIDLIELIRKQNAVEWLAVRDGVDCVRIYNKEGEGIITRIPNGDDPLFAYRYREKDPLGYATNPKLKPMLTDKSFDAQIWEKKTIAEPLPNAVVALGNLFADPRVGDILVVLEDPRGFRRVKAGTHGSLSQSDMHIPLLIAGPTVPKGIYGFAKGVDIFPTVLSWFGLPKKMGENQEGKPLFETGQKTRRYSHQELLKRYRLNIDKLNKFIADAGAPENPLNIPEKLKKYMHWHLNQELKNEETRLAKLTRSQSIW